MGNVQSAQPFSSEMLVDAFRKPLLVLGGDLRVKTANRTYSEFFGCAPEFVQNRFLSEIQSGQWNIPDLLAELKDLSSEKNRFEGLAAHKVHTPQGDREITISGSRLDDSILLEFTDLTERLRTEESVRETNLQLKMVLEAANLGTWDLDFRTGKLIWSDTCKLIFGLPVSAEMTRERFVSMIHPDDVSVVKDSVRRTKEKEADSGKYSTEFRCIRADGAIRWIKSNGQMFFEGNEPVRLIGTALDVTETMQTEMALRRSEAWFRLLVDATPQIVWTARPDGQRDYWNKKWFEYTGATLEQCAGWKWLQYVLPEDAERITGIWNQSVKTGENFEAEYRLKSANGSYRWHLVRAHPLRDEAGKIMRWMGTATDIDDKRRSEEERARNADAERRRRAEAELAERRANFLARVSDTLASSLDFITTVTSVSQLAVPHFADICAVDILECDQAIRRVASTHASPESAAIGRQLEHRYPPALNGASSISQVLRTGKTQWRAQVSDAVLYAIARDEEHLRLLRQLNLTSVIIVPLLARGRTVGAITFAIVESKRRFERDDVALAEDLGRRVGLAVDNARLYRETQWALFTAKKAVGSRDELLAIVSHDLRNPLNAIKLSADLLLEVFAGDAKARKPVETIEHAVARMSRLIEDLLDIASIDAGSLSIKRQSCDARLIIEQACETIEGSAHQKGITLKCERIEDMAPLDCDPARVVQVLGNIIGNAVKFTPPTGNIAVHAAQQGGDVRFSVKDTGPGIPEDQFEHIFDRYWQAKDTSHAGVGLGLAIAKGIVESHGGQIWVESEVGRGSAFYFTIPVVDESKQKQ